MNIIETIQEIKKLRDRKEIIFRLLDFDFIFEYDTSISNSDAIDTVYLLIDWVLQEKDEDVRDTLFSAIDDVILYRKIGETINWDHLFLHLSQFSSNDLIWILAFFGDSKQEKYLSTLYTYKNDTNKNIREVVLIAIDTITKK